MKSLFSNLFLFFLAITFFTGCVKNKDLLFNSSRSGEFAEGLKYFEEFSASNTFTLESLAATAKITYSDDMGKIKLKSFILIRLPGMMRIEMLNLFGQPYFILNFFNKELHLYSTVDNLYDYRSDRDDNLGDLFSKFDMLIPIIFGDFGYLEDSSLEKTIVHDDGKYIELFLQKVSAEDNVYFDLLIEPLHSRIYQLKCHEMCNGLESKEYLITYKKFVEMESIVVPVSIELEFKQMGKKSILEINFSDFVVNEPINPDKFNFKHLDNATKGYIPRVFDWLN